MPHPAVQLKREAGIQVKVKETEISVNVKAYFHWALPVASLLFKSI
jgi:hypothetical protein